jgi:uncharacterized Zn finger protein
MADYDINGTIFYNVPLLHKGGAYVKERLAAAWLSLIQPMPGLDEWPALVWRERLKNSRQLARSGVVHALAVRPGRLAARVEHPLTKAMHNVKINAPVAREQAWSDLTAQASREAQVIAQIVNGALPESFISSLLLARHEIVFQADGASLSLDQPPDSLFATPWLVFAERVDADPWLWVLFRGQTQDGLLDLIRQHGRAQAAASRSSTSLMSEMLPLDRFWRMGEVAQTGTTAKDAKDAKSGKSPVLTRLAKPSAGLRIGKRALSGVLRRAYVRKRG